MFGTVRHFGGTYGFITGDDGCDAFVHYSDIIVADDGFRALAAGERVEFELTEAERGLRAKSVRKIGE